MAGQVILKKKARPVVPRLNHVVATCPGGAERALEREMDALGFRDLVIETGAVRGTTTEDATVVDANVALRTASRVLVPVTRFSANDFDEVYRGIAEIPWEALLPAERSFAISAGSRMDALRDHRFLAMRVKDGIVDRQRYGGPGGGPGRGTAPRSSVNRDNPDLPVVVFAADGYVELSFDSSGRPLHERGYRTERGEAPLRETVAALMAMQALGSGLPAGGVILDPFCGSGTIAIETALLASRRIPGAIGRRYSWERWSWLEQAIPGIGRRRSEVVQHYGRHEGPPGFSIIASDHDASLVSVARRNAERAGVSNRIAFRSDDMQVVLKDVLSHSSVSHPVVIVSNPPYGERLKPEDLRGLYRQLGDTLKHSAAGAVLWLILSESAPYRELGLAPDRRDRVFNGGLAAQLCRYAIRGRSTR